MTRVIRLFFSLPRRICRVFVDLRARSLSHAQVGHAAHRCATGALSYSVVVWRRAHGALRSLPHHQSAAVIQDYSARLLIMGPWTK